MRVFLSWSDPRSEQAARALREWLPDVIQALDPWMSAVDIGSGERWGREIDERLEESRFGIICVTRSNPAAPWLNFEAGAIAKRLADDSRVCPYLLDHSSPEELPSVPLSRFQAEIADEEGTYSLLSLLNEALDDGLSEQRLERLFERFWPDLEQRLAGLPASEGEQEERATDDMLEEILGHVRAMSRRMSQTPPDLFSSSKSIFPGTHTHTAFPGQDAESEQKRKGSLALGLLTNALQEKIEDEIEGLKEDVTEEVEEPDGGGDTN